MKRYQYLIATLLYISLLFPMQIKAEKSIYVPTFSGTLRARYEYLTQENKSAFKVRNLRLGIDGYVAPIMSYRAEADFCDWGKVVLVDGFIKFAPVEGLYFNFGQARMPFTIAAHRQPYQQFFVSRAFLSQHLGIRDVGISGGYTLSKIPLTAQASFFNCSGTNIGKSFFTNTYGFTVKLYSQIHPYWYVSASTARLKRGISRSQDWDIGTYFDNGLWHVEAEYLRKEYVHHVFKPVNSYDFFVFRNFPIEKKGVGGISGAIRYDYMSDHSSGIPTDEGVLVADSPECHRLTLGATLSLQTKFQADIRLNYEKYFLNEGITPTLDTNDKLVLEIIAHF